MQLNAPESIERTSLNLDGQYTSMLLNKVKGEESYQQ